MARQHAQVSVPKDGDRKCGWESWAKGGSHLRAEQGGWVAVLRVLTINLAFITALRFELSH